MKFVLIGCGGTAHSYATVILGHPGMILSAVVDEYPDAARAFGHSFNCDSYTTLQDYAADNHFADWGIICTPGPNDPGIADQLMRLGTNIFCETPFVQDSVTSEKMIDVSRTFGVQLTTGSRFRYLTDIAHARELIQSGILGRILVFEIDFRDMVDGGSCWDSRKDRGSHGILFDRGNHAIDIARYFFGPLLRIRVEEDRRLRSQVVEFTVRIDMRTISGVIGTAQLSWKIKHACDDYIRIYGTRGTLCVGWKSSMYRLHGQDWIKFGEGYSTLKALARRMETMLDIATCNWVPETTAEDVHESVRAIEAAQRSLSTGHWIGLQPTPPELEMPRQVRNFTVLGPGKLLSPKT